MTDSEFIRRYNRFAHTMKVKFGNLVTKGAKEGEQVSAACSWFGNDPDPRTREGVAGGTTEYPDQPFVLMHDEYRGIVQACESGPSLWTMAQKSEWVRLIFLPEVQSLHNTSKAELTRKAIVAEAAFRSLQKTLLPRESGWRAGQPLPPAHNPFQVVWSGEGPSPLGQSPDAPPIEVTQADVRRVRRQLESSNLAVGILAVGVIGLGVWMLRRERRFREKERIARRVGHGPADRKRRGLPRYA